MSYDDVQCPEDPIGIGMTDSCVHDTSLTDLQVFIKLACIVHWVFLEVKGGGGGGTSVFF